MLEDFGAEHGEGGEAFGDIFGGGGLSGAAAGDAEDVGLIAVGAHVGGEDAAFVFAGGAEEGGSGTVAKEDAGGAVLPVSESGEFFGSDDEGVFESTTFDEAFGDLHGVEEAGAGGGDVKGDGVFGAEVLLNVAGGGGGEGIGGDGGDDDEVDFFGLGTGLIEGFLGGFGTHVGGEFVLGGDAAFFNAGAGDDPFVGGLDHFGEVIVRENFFRKIASGSGNGDALAHGRSEGERALSCKL